MNAAAKEQTGGGFRRWMMLARRLWLAGAAYQAAESAGRWVRDRPPSNQQPGRAESPTGETWQKPAGRGLGNPALVHCVEGGDSGYREAYSRAVPVTSTTTGVANYGQAVQEREPKSESNRAATVWLGDEPAPLWIFISRSAALTGSGVAIPSLHGDGYLFQNVLPDT